MNTCSHIVSDRSTAAPLYIIITVLFESAETPALPEPELGPLLADMVLLDIQVMMNIVNRGCCNFHGATICCEGTDRHNSRVSGDHYLYIMDKHIYIEGLTPDVEIARVYDWYNKLSISKRVLSATPADIAIYACHQLSLFYSDSPYTTLWLSHAIEALYDNPTLRIQNTLIDRSRSFLQVPITDIKQYKRDFRKFYDYRSKWAHGDGQWAHPLATHMHDPGVRHHHPEMSDNISFGFSIILETLRRYISDDIQRLLFSEIQKGGNIVE